jgi:hypothetical protein
MTLASPEPRQGLTLANIPAWVMLLVALGSPVVAGFTTSALNARDVAEMRAEQADMREWRRATEKRLAEGEKVSAVSSAKVEMALDSLKTGIASLQAAMMVNPRPQPQAANHP